MNYRITIKKEEKLVYQTEWDELDPLGAIWGDATCIIPWNMYLFTGDKTILEQHFDYMKAWVDYIEGVEGQDHGWRKVFHYGDWLALDCPYFGQNQV